MNEHMRIIFYENPDIDELIRDFCRTDPEYQRIKREFTKPPTRYSGESALTCTRSLNSAFTATYPAMPISIISSDWVFVKRFCALFGRTDPAVCGDGTYPRDHTPK